jgi:undecaprenyl-diphosphatase
VFRTPGEPGRPIGPAWVASAARDITALGSATVITILVGVVCLGLAAARRRTQALLVLGASVSGFLVSALLKGVFARDRPDLELRAVEVWSSSFPSGHSMNSAVVYLTLAVLVAQSQSRWRERVLALATGIGLAVLVGTSRVYLGVHWPSDVLAGWMAGFAWAGLWGFVSVYVRRRGRPTA